MPLIARASHSLLCSPCDNAALFTEQYSFSPNPTPVSISPLRTVFAFNSPEADKKTVATQSAEVSLELNEDRTAKAHVLNFRNRSLLSSKDNKQKQNKQEETGKKSKKSLFKKQSAEKKAPTELPVGHSTCSAKVESSPTIQSAETVQVDQENLAFETANNVLDRERFNWIDEVEGTQNSYLETGEGRRFKVS